MSIEPRSGDAPMSARQDRHYEVLVAVNPEFSDQVVEMTKGYCETIKEGGGDITRTEDWGRLNLAYRIGKHNKGHYFLMNFSCDDYELIDRFKDTLEKDDLVIRTLMIRTDKPVSEQSAMMISINEEKAEKELAAKAMAS